MGAEYELTFMKSNKPLVIGQLIIRPYGQIQIEAALANQEPGFNGQKLDRKGLVADLKPKQALHILVGSEKLGMHVLLWKHGETEVFTLQHYPEAIKWLRKRGYEVLEDIATQQPGPE